MKTTLLSTKATLPKEDILETINRKLSNGVMVDINTTDEHGHTALLIAAVRDGADFLKLLKNPNVDTTRKNISGDNFLHLICESGKQSKTAIIEAINFAVNKKMNINALNNFGETCLHTACMSYNAISSTAEDADYQIILQLLKNGADLNLQTSCGYTPLYLACIHNKIGAVKALMQYKPDLSLAYKSSGNSQTVLGMLEANENINPDIISHIKGYNLVDDYLKQLMADKISIKELLQHRAIDNINLKEIFTKLVQDSKYLDHMEMLIKYEQEAAKKIAMTLEEFGKFLITATCEVADKPYLELLATQQRKYFVLEVTVEPVTLKIPDHEKSSDAASDLIGENDDDNPICSI